MPGVMTFKGTKAPKSILMPEGYRPTGVMAGGSFARLAIADIENIDGADFVIRGDRLENLTGKADVTIFLREVSF